MLDRQSSVTSVLTQVEIDAPADLVWNTILDFPSYTEWNPFVRYQAITDPSYKTVLPDQTPLVGSSILLKVPVPPAVGMTDPSQIKSTTRQTITFLNQDSKTVIWDLSSFPSWFLTSRREQSVIEVVQQGKTLAKYTSLEVMNGPGAWLIKWFIINRLQNALNAVGDAIKTYVEQKAKHTT